MNGELVGMISNALVNLSPGRPAGPGRAGMANLMIKQKLCISFSCQVDVSGSVGVQLGNPGPVWARLRCPAPKSEGRESCT